MLRYSSISLFHVFISFSHTLPHFPARPFTFTPSFSLSDLCLLLFSLSRLSLFPLSGPVRHQRRVFRRRDGAPDADSDSGGVHAVCGGVLQRLRALHGRRHQEGEAPRRGQQRRGRQEEFWESLRQGQQRIIVKTSNTKTKESLRYFSKFLAPYSSLPASLLTPHRFTCQFLGKL